MLPLSANQIEGATLTAWPALKQAYDGLWLWRYARGFTRRANSIQCLDPVDGAFAELRLARLADLSRRNRIAPVFRVTPLTAPEIVDVLDTQGWEKIGPSLVLAMDTPAANFPVEFAVRGFEPSDPEWYKAVAYLSGYDPKAAEVLRDIVSAIPGEAQGVLVLHKAGVPAAAALAVVASGIGVYLNVATHPSARRSGFGRAVMAASINWTRTAGARHSAIQVSADNAAAIPLYKSFGFKQVYTYHYRRAPALSVR